MKTVSCFLLVLSLTVSCTKKEPEPLAGTSQLVGQWKSTDFPIAVTVDFSSTDKTAKVTAIATNSYSFRVGDLFWKEVVPTGPNTFRIAQLTKSNVGYYVFVAGKATLTKDNQLNLVFSGDTDDAKQLKLDGKRATFPKQ